jgi:hypothetical protein
MYRDPEVLGFEMMGNSSYQTSVAEPESFISGAKININYYFKLKILYLLDIIIIRHSKLFGSKSLI